jgi:hypothetical protein
MITNKQGISGIIMSIRAKIDRKHPQVCKHPPLAPLSGPTSIMIPMDT